MIRVIFQYGRVVLDIRIYVYMYMNRLQRVIGQFMQRGRNWKCVFGQNWNIDNFVLIVFVQNVVEKDFEVILYVEGKGFMMGD